MKKSGAVLMGICVALIAVAAEDSSPRASVSSEVQRLRAEYDAAVAREEREAIVVSAYRLARALESEGRQDEALQLLAKNLESAQRSMSGGVLVSQLSRMHHRRGEQTEAVAILSDSIVIAKRRSQERMEVELLLERANQYLSTDELGKAEDDLNLSLELATAIGDSISSDTALYGLQVLNEKRGDARSASERCLQRFEIALAGRSGFLEDVVADCARLLEQTGNRKAADDVRQRAQRAVKHSKGSDPNQSHSQ